MKMNDNLLAVLFGNAGYGFGVVIGVITIGSIAEALVLSIVAGIGGYLVKFIIDSIRKYFIKRDSNAVD